MSNAEERFELARKNLANALQNLEKTFKKKIDQANIEAKIVNIGEDNDDIEHLESKIAEQEIVIKALNNEINRLQSTLSNVGIEIEFATERNKMISKKTEDFRINGPKIIKAIEAEISLIENLIKNDHD